MIEATPSVVARIAHHARMRSSEPALAFVARAGDATELSWADLDSRVCHLARYLVGRGVEPGQVVFVLSALPQEQAIGFLAVLAAGAVPSILSFPSVKQSRERFFDTLRPIARATAARWILSAHEFADVAALADANTQVVELPNDDVLAKPDSAVALPAPGQDFLQFSSGTTGLRKCVRITSQMLASQANGYAAALRLSLEDRVASWLPLYHDMGLIAAFIIPIYSGNLSIHMSPFDWLKEPAFFLGTIQRYRATLAWMPNFAFGLTATQITDAEVSQLDLGCLRALINCGEPVRATAQDAFLARFGRVGARADQLHACYAMAEGTFAATQTVRGRVDRVDGGVFAARHRALPAATDVSNDRSISFVSSGSPVGGMDLRIDGASTDRHVGEILLRGPSVFSGYGIDGNDRSAFTGDSWFRTGDLGYVADGELFVTGRSKDLIIHRGSNVYPTDVEEVVGGCEGVQPGRAVVFGTFDKAMGTEQIVVMLEVTLGQDESELRRRVREAVWRELSVAIADVRVCPPGSLVKSTSGKLSRPANREHYLRTEAPPSEVEAHGSRADVAEQFIAPRDLWEQRIASLWEDVLNVRPIGIRDNVFLDLGADSLSTMRVASEIHRQWKREIPPTELLGADTVERQAALLRVGERRAETLVTLQRKGRGGSLFIVHAAGGWAFPYVTLARRLGAERPVHAFQAPQLTAGDVASMTVESAADEYLRALRKVQPKGPYYLSGWSFGGLVAFEMANRLRASGDEVSRLVLFDTAPPERRVKQMADRLRMKIAAGVFEIGLRIPWLHDRIPPLRDIRRMAPLWRFFAGAHLSQGKLDVGRLLRFAFDERCDLERLVRSTDDELWTYLVELANEKPSPEDQLLLIPGIDGASARRALAVSKRLEELNTSYATSWVYDGVVDVFGVRGNEKLAMWQARASRPLRVQWFDVKQRLINPHFDMMEDQNVALFAPALRKLLRDADAEIRPHDSLAVCP
jgi:fatty-acyl-CoA synthase